MDTTTQERLKAALQAEQDASKLETLAACLVGRLLGIPITVAKAGFQHGGDAGTAGQHGRRLRLECKKYGDNTALSDRELLGEIDHAIARDGALEAWILIATRSVSEQLAQDLTQKGERFGVPVIIIDWTEHELAPLAALCAVAPELVELLFSANAAECARALQPSAGDAINALQRNLQSWCLGFDLLRAQSHSRVKEIWTSRRTSIAEFGQDAAGGALTTKIRRQSVCTALTSWWQGSAQRDAPVALVGWDGVGKTWAALDWLTERLRDLPIVLVIPSSALDIRSAVSAQALKRFFAQRLYDLTAVRDSEHWLRRLDFLLKRPTEEGPVLIVLFDGLNQEPSAPWLQILKALQGSAFESRVRVMISTRNFHLEGRLSNLRGLVIPAVKVPVDPYDTTPGGELDQMLAFHGLRQSDFHPDLIDLARTPRLFALVLRFRERLVEAGCVTVHRLLWEYGRDTLGVRAGNSFSEDEWRAWLVEVASRYRSGIQRYSMKALAEMTGRTDLSERQVYARLSDIIDGRFATGDGTQLNPVVVTHGLAVALLQFLSTQNAETFSSVEGALTQWLDPIASLDQRAEILRAGVSIVVECGSGTATPAAGALVTAWLHSQNITETHRHELTLLAPSIPDALLDAIEHSEAQAQASARLWAINALREIPRESGPALAAIVTRLCGWLSIVSREIDQSAALNAELERQHAEVERQRAERYRSRIGVDVSGPRRVLGVDLTLTDWEDGTLQSLAPSILDGFPLVDTISCFEVAAVSLAVRGHADAWEGLKWLCYLNGRDPAEMSAALRKLSATIYERRPEPGIHPDLPARAAALLLWLTGHEADDHTAASINPSFGIDFCYQRDYLANPSKSFYELERRHADVALCDKERPLHARLQRTAEFWLDPTFSPPEQFVDELRATLKEYQVEKLNKGPGPTPQDRFFEQLEPVLARCAPDLLATLVRRKLESLDACPPESRYWAAIRATDHLLLATDKGALAAEKLRLSARCTNESEEAIAASHLLEIELTHLSDALSQYERVVNADLKMIPIDLRFVLEAPSALDVDSLIARYGHDGSPKQQKDLLHLLGLHPIRFSNSAWAYLSNLALKPDHEEARVLFRTLTLSDANRFGRTLAANDWSWNPAVDFWVNHYGTDSLISAELNLPFDQLAPRLAPWRLLHAARARGEDPAEVRLAAEIFGGILTDQTIPVPDLGSTLTVDLSQTDFPDFISSVQPSPTPAELGDPAASFRAMFDMEARVKAEIRAYETAIIRIRDARIGGASLYLATIESEDVRAVLRHAPEFIDLWIEGYRERTAAFVTRVNLAESAFLALCEALLESDPVRGADLWRALRAISLNTRYVCIAGIDELLNIAFRASDSAASVSVRAETVQLAHCNTDRDLLNVAVSAISAGKPTWIDQQVARDDTSSLVLRNRRGTLLAGLRANNSVPIPEAWREGEPTTDCADLRRRSARMRSAEGCAHHWWRKYVKAQSAEESYAAWVLFLRSADPRGWAWVSTYLQSQTVPSKLAGLKMAHVRLNYSSLKRAMGTRFDRLEARFLGERIVKNVWPWKIPAPRAATDSKQESARNP